MASLPHRVASLNYAGSGSYAVVRAILERALDSASSCAGVITCLPIRPSHEGVQYRLVAGLIDLEHNAHAVAATPSNAVEVAGRVADHTSVGVAAIGPTGEAVQHRLIAGRADFEHHARVRCATVGSSPVEVAFGGKGRVMRLSATNVPSLISLSIQL